MGRAIQTSAPPSGALAACAAPPCTSAIAATSLAAFVAVMVVASTLALAGALGAVTRVEPAEALREP
jgi:hypothetical protein